jgi:transcriptional regulator with XRE-family HTH domain
MPANPIDIRVGQLIRLRRQSLGMTQHDLGQQAGCKFQQIQKYETGANRVSASRLKAIADALNVRPSFFFEENISESAADKSLLDALADGNRRYVKLVTAFNSLDENLQLAALDMICAMAKSADKA